MFMGERPLADVELFGWTGSNENTNGLLRQYLPKGIDISSYSQAKLNAVARQLNERPRKTLGFQTPAEMFSQPLRRSVESASVRSRSRSGQGVTGDPQEHNLLSGYAVRLIPNRRQITKIRQRRSRKDPPHE
jgi:hypothetical protein